MSRDCCEKQLVADALRKQERRVLAIVLAINLTTFVLMVAAAMHSGSSSLLSGGLDNLGDTLTYAVSLAVVGSTLQVKSRVALLKSALILLAAIAVAIQIAWRLAHPATPIFASLGIAALLNLAANLVCLRLLTPYRHGDVNLASAWECSRNDVGEGLAVLAAALGVWLFGNGWPDLLVAVALLAMFLRSALRVFRASLDGLKAPAG
ncbi:cation efflux family protein [Luteimonas cucumeris]|uniref:Cation efflux family protein n=1 Tax=Luteimonas cucumeris TaxID=985012 RepID=A0A562L7Q7_9GAMM|nr:cation transporter [Luteimonas cucumeris]TWI03658.1 cation efflux family protein [Luteimonas cucumeris]